MTRTEMLERLTVLLAGRAAEDLVFDEVSTGAQDDLERATHMARSMVANYGMSEKLGPMTYGASKRPQFLEDALPFPRHEATEETVREIDQEVRALLGQARSQAREILESRRAVLDSLAHLLLEKETIESDELRRLIGSQPDSAPPSSGPARPQTGDDTV